MLRGDTFCRLRKKPTLMPRKRRVVKNSFNDVLIKFIDRAYSLCNSGNFVGVLFFGMVVIGFIAAARLSEEHLNTHIGTMLKMLSSEKYYLFPMNGVIIILVIALYLNHRVYTAEIKRLTSGRSRLVHGLEEKTLRPIKEHRSSGVDLDDT